MAEEFRLRGAAGSGPGPDGDPGRLDEFSGARRLNELLEELQRAGAIEGPPGLEIIVYPGSAAEGDAVVITVFSALHPDAHVVAACAEMRRLAARELWEGADAAALSAAVLEGTIERANEAIATVRAIEGRRAGGSVDAAARCPRCGAEGGLRVEYRHRLLGLSVAGDLLLADGELTDIFCLACGEEVEDVLGPEGPVPAGGGGEGRA